MRFTLLSVFASVVLIACSEANMTTPSEPSKPVIQPVSNVSDKGKSCGADRLQHLVGQKKTKLDVMRFANPIRVILPGMAVTKDYRQNRINFDIDENGIIARIHCG